MADETNVYEKKIRKPISTFLGLGFILIGVFYFLFLFLVNEIFLTIFLFLSNCSVCWVFIHAGVNYINQENLGRNMIACTIPTIFFPLLTVIIINIRGPLHIVTGTINLSPVEEIKFIQILLFITINIWGILLILHLWKKNDHFNETDIDKKIKTSKILSYFSPGFAHIILEKYWIGYVIYFFFIISQLILLMPSMGCPKLLTIGIYFLVWFTLSKNDRKFIETLKKTYTKIQ